MPIDHEITIEERPYFSSGTTYVAVCSCGRYRSGKQTFKGYAEKFGADHVKAKGGDRG